MVFELFAEDVTERRALEQQLRQSQKMEAVGRLAGGIAHDFNNLLMVILGYSEFLLERLGAEPHLRGPAQEIASAAERASSLTRQLLAFSRKQMLAPRIVNLNDVATENLKMLDAHDRRRHRSGHGPQPESLARARRLPARSSRSS